MKRAVECGCAYDTERDGIWWCPLHLKAKEMELQNQELQKQIDDWRRNLMEEVKDRKEKERLLGVFRKALEDIDNWRELAQRPGGVWDIHTIIRNAFAEEKQTEKRKCACGCHSAKDGGNVACGCCHYPG